MLLCGFVVGLRAWLAVLFTEEALACTALLRRLHSLGSSKTAASSSPSLSPWWWTVGRGLLRLLCCMFALDDSQEGFLCCCSWCWNTTSTTATATTAAAAAATTLIENQEGKKGNEGQEEDTLKQEDGEDKDEEHDDEDGDDTGEDTQAQEVVAVLLRRPRECRWLVLLAAIISRIATMGWCVAADVMVPDSPLWVSSDAKAFQLLVSPTMSTMATRTATMATTGSHPTATPTTSSATAFAVVSLLLKPFTRWDSAHFLSVAKEGYGWWGWDGDDDHGDQRLKQAKEKLGDGDDIAAAAAAAAAVDLLAVVEQKQAFFPLYPLLVRWTTITVWAVYDWTAQRASHCWVSRALGMQLPQSPLPPSLQPPPSPTTTTTTRLVPPPWLFVLSAVVVSNLCFVWAALALFQLGLEVFRRSGGACRHGCRAGCGDGDRDSIESRDTADAADNYDHDDDRDDDHNDDDYDDHEDDNDDHDCGKDSGDTTGCCRYCCYVVVGRRKALVSSLLFCVANPASVFFSTAYSESLFAALTFTALWLLERDTNNYMIRSSDDIKINCGNVTPSGSSGGRITNVKGLVDTSCSTSRIRDISNSSSGGSGSSSSSISRTAPTNIISSCALVGCAVCLLTLASLTRSNGALNTLIFLSFHAMRQQQPLPIVRLLLSPFFSFPDTEMINTTDAANHDHDDNDDDDNPLVRLFTSSLPVPRPPLPFRLTQSRYHHQRQRGFKQRFKQLFVPLFFVALPCLAIKLVIACVAPSLLFDVFGYATLCSCDIYRDQQHHQQQHHQQHQKQHRHNKSSDRPHLNLGDGSMFSNIFRRHQCSHRPSPLLAPFLLNQRPSWCPRCVLHDDKKKRKKKTNIASTTSSSTSTNSHDKEEICGHHSSRFFFPSSFSQVRARFQNKQQFHQQTQQQQQLCVQQQQQQQYQQQWYGDDKAEEEEEEEDVKGLWSVVISSKQPLLHSYAHWRWGSSDDGSGGGTKQTYCRGSGVYGCVQQAHWGVDLVMMPTTAGGGGSGSLFGSYWTLKQLPNFVLASPVLALTCYGVWTFFVSIVVRRRFTVRGKMGTRSRSGHGSQCHLGSPTTPLPPLSPSPSPPLRSSLPSPQLPSPPSPSLLSSSSPALILAVDIATHRLLPYVLQMALLATVVFLWAHVQISTRLLAAGCPALYWFLAQALVVGAPPRKRNARRGKLMARRRTQKKRIKTSARSPWRTAVWCWLLVFGVVGPFFHANSLPWT